jgi:transmembrane sensor
MDDGNLQALPEHEAPLATAWLEGRRQYRNEPLRYVLADVDRYTGQKIELANEAAGDLRFTGTLNFQNSAAWLRGLSVALPVIVTQEDDGILLVKQK